MNIISQGFPKNKLRIDVSEKNRDCEKENKQVNLKITLQLWEQYKLLWSNQKKPFTLLLMAWLHFSPIGKAHESQVSFTNYKKQN